MSIFVSIASYRDPVLRFTLESARDNARSPDALHFAIVDQSDVPVEVPEEAISLHLDPAQARGPCWARAIAMSFYRGEDWFLQLDSHMDFAPGWDERLVTQAQALSPRRKGVVLTTYPDAFTLVDGKPVRKVTTNGVIALVVIKGKQFEPGLWTLPFEGFPMSVQAIVPGFHVGAGCLFATGRMALEIPYDPALYFHGEEQSLALRLYTRGWDVFHIADMPIYHMYNDAPSGVKRPVHWDPAEEAKRAIKWLALENQSRARLDALIRGVPLGVYGLGSERSLAEFAAFSGIDYAKREVAPHAYLPRPPQFPGASVSMRLSTTAAVRGNWSG